MNLVIGRIWVKFNFQAVLNEYFKNVICKATGAIDVFEIEEIQRLWSGYGKISRLGLADSRIKSVVVKHVKFPNKVLHPRGWNSKLSHERKIKSYEVETAWYKHWSSRCDDACKIPKCFAIEKYKGEVLIVLEDLNETEFTENRVEVVKNEIEACLFWLANFHALFMRESLDGLWEQGTYWHLATRPDELEALQDLELKSVAQLIDQELSESQYQTIVHGDAKLANFCFTNDGNKAAAVDFQYVGGGCGIKDVAYFLGSCLTEEECEEQIPEFLNFYFEALNTRLGILHKEMDATAIEKEWRLLFPVAWADFHRFLKGWSPEHWKINSYSERVTKEVIQLLKGN